MFNYQPKYLEFLTLGPQIFKASNKIFDFSTKKKNLKLKQIPPPSFEILTRHFEITFVFILKI